MSLLLDALKRAEQEKLARRGQEPPPAERAELEPGKAAGASVQRRSFELESHEPASPDSPVAEPAAASRPDREGAKAIFAAKKALPSLPTETPARKNKAILAIAIGSVALAAAGGAYVWYEINATPGTVARAPLPVPAPKPVTPAAGASLQSASGAVAPASGAAAPAASGTEATLTEAAADRNAKATPPVALLKPKSAPAAPAQTRPPPREAERLAMNLLDESAKARPAAPLRLARTIEPPRVSADVSQGFEALKRGDAAAARRYYEAAVAADPTGLDAHLGLAAAAARSGDRDTAANQYRRTLALDPKNPAAIAGLASLADFTRPEALEAQLRADITRYPQSPALHFTLGNLYASQSRWNEAQSAYFEAYRMEPENADLAFNLAVSLDHLGQSRPAADFYQRALVAAERQAALFDKGQVSRRISELKP